MSLACVAFSSGFRAGYGPSGPVPIS